MSNWWQFHLFHSVSPASKEVCKSDCSWDFFNHSDRQRQKLGAWTSELLVTYARGAVITYITRAMPKALLLSVCASPLEGVPLPALVPFLVELP